MNEFFNAIGPVLSILALVSIVGGIAGYFKASRGDSIIKYQTIEISNLRTKISDQDKEKAQLEADKKALEVSCATKDETIAEQGRHIKYLQKLGQGSPQLKKLTTAIENQTTLINKLLEERVKS